VQVATLFLPRQRVSVSSVASPDEFAMIAPLALANAL
jgi:hypothetical protein